MAYSKQTWDTTSYVNPTRMNHIEDGIYDVSAKVEKKYTNTESYDFPKKASEISGSNDIYTVQNKGTAFLSYVFNSDTYSQFGFTVNDLYPVQGNITSGGKNLEGVRSTISFPVQAGDKIQVSFYSSYGMASLRLRVIY